MTHQLRTLIAIIAVLGLALLADPLMAQTVEGGHYGDVQLRKPAGSMRGLVVLYSDLSGWSDAENHVADLLAGQGILVIGVDTARYAGTLASVAEACHYLVGDVEAISHQVQREQHSTIYFTPILAGTGSGGTLAERVLAAAASNTIAGAVSIDPTAKLDSRFHPCPPDPTILHDPGLPGFWSIGATAALPAETLGLIAQLQRAGANVDLVNSTRSNEPGTILLTHLCSGIWDHKSRTSETFPICRWSNCRQSPGATCWRLCSLATAAGAIWIRRLLATCRSGGYPS
jgi:type IV secretory pathway VirJ component